MCQLEGILERIAWSVIRGVPARGYFRQDRVVAVIRGAYAPLHGELLNPFTAKMSLENDR